MNKLIRQAKKSDFPKFFPILGLIFEEMELDSIASVPEQDFYNLMQKGFEDETYRYSYNRVLVHETTGNVDGILCSYSNEDEAIIDAPIEKYYPEFNIDPSLKIFTDKESLPEEWYLDSIAVAPAAWGKGIASSLLAALPEVASKNGYKKISLNVDKTNPNAKKLYLKNGFVDAGELPIGAHMYDHMIKEV